MHLSACYLAHANLCKFGIPGWIHSILPEFYPILKVSFMVESYHIIELKFDCLHSEKRFVVRIQAVMETHQISANHISSYVGFSFH